MKYDNDFNHINGLEATMFIVQKNWSTMDKKKITYHFGFIYKKIDTYIILHNRNSIALPNCINTSTGVVSHILTPSQFSVLLGLWSSERTVRSYGGGTLQYSMYY